MNRRWAATAAALAGLAVALGAFGAHGLKAMVTAERLAVWDTAVRYQMYHALALLAVAGREPAVGARGGWLFLAGIALFSGSLYALVLSGDGWLGAITPLGGLCFVAGWVMLAVEFGRQRPA